MSARDRALEEEALTRAERSVGLMGLGFSEAVLERLDTVGAKHGDLWLERTTVDLVNELREETADIGGWGLLLLQLVLRDAGLDPDRSMNVRLLLEQVMGHAADIENILRQIIRELRE